MRYLLAIILFCFLFKVDAQRTVGALQNDTSAFNGYTLFAPLGDTKTYLIDNCGYIVKDWASSNYTPGASVYLLEDGSLLRTCKLLTGSIIAGGSGGRLEKYDWNDSLVWSYNYDSPTYRSHHDIVPLANGNIILIAWDVKSKTEAINHGLDTNLYSGEVWSEKIVEIEPIGSNGIRVVWEWYLWDHIVQDFDSTLANFGNIRRNFDRVNLNYFNNNGISKDYFHANSLSYNEDLDQLMISIRNFDEFWVIDHSTTTQEAKTASGGNSGKGGRILYRWGNPEAYGEGTINDKKLFGQHDPHWIPKGYRDEDKIIVFNNGYNRSPQISVAQIITPPVDSNGNYTKLANQEFAPLLPDWEYTMPNFVDFVSGASRLENGNTLLSSGPDGTLIEIDDNDSVVWKYVSPVSAGGQVINQGSTPSNNVLFRATKYSTFYPGFAGKNISPISTIEVNPPSFSCNLFVGISELIDHENPSTLVSNPFTNTLTIKTTAEQKRVQIFSFSGNLIYDQKHQSSTINIESSNWSNGMYFILISSKTQVEKIKAVKVN